MEKVNVNGGSIALGHPIGKKGGRPLLVRIWIHIMGSQSDQDPGCKKLTKIVVKKW